MHVNSKSTDKHNFNQNSTVIKLLFQLLPLATHAQSRVKITGFIPLLSLLVFQLSVKTWKQFRSQTILNPLQSLFIAKGIVLAATPLDFGILVSGITSSFQNTTFKTALRYDPQLSFQRFLAFLLLKPCLGLIKYLDNKHVLSPQ